MTRSQPALAVGIPTYNRSEKLRSTIARVRTLIRDGGHAADVVLFVSDNASTDDTAAVCAQAQGVDDGVTVRFVRQPVNIGLGANVHAVCRDAPAEHVWVLSDDDVPAADAPRVILDAIAAHRPDLLYFNFDQPLASPHHLVDGEADHLLLPSLPEQFAAVNRSRKISAWCIRRSALQQASGEYLETQSRRFYWGTLAMPIAILGALDAPRVVLHRAVIARSDQEFDHWGHPPMDWRAEAGVWRHPVVERADPSRFAQPEGYMLQSWLTFLWLWRTGRLVVPEHLHAGYMASLPGFAEGIRLLRGMGAWRVRFALLKLTGGWGPRLANGVARLLGRGR
ncbi:MAG: glycosyltransferase family 2 protein [Planctomycetota bacterium]|jgi:glycosyltransferase involved in cell wall biosynthesis